MTIIANHDRMCSYLFRYLKSQYQYDDIVKNWEYWNKKHTRCVGELDIRHIQNDIIYDVYEVKSLYRSSLETKARSQLRRYQDYFDLYKHNGISYTGYLVIPETSNGKIVRAIPLVDNTGSALEKIIEVI